MEYDTETQLTEFNSNKATLQRVHQLIINYYGHSNHDNYEMMFKQLNNLRMECHYKMKGRYKKFKPKSRELFTNLEAMYELFMRNNNEFNIRQKVRRGLYNYMEFLMWFMGERGMLLTDKEEDDGL